MLTDPLAIIGIFMFGAAAGSLVSYRRHKDVSRDSPKAPEASSQNLSVPSAASPFRGIKALIVARNPEMLGIFSHLFHEIHIEIHKCAAGSDAIDRLSAEKFELVVLDFDEIAGCADVVNYLLVTRPNEKSVLFAVASNSQVRQTAFDLEIPFVIERPLVPSLIGDLLRTVYGRMLRDCQAYCRFAVELPVSIQRNSGPLLQCTTTNLSQNGLALNSPSPLYVGEQLKVLFAIPNSDLFVSAEGTVIWEDKHGKAGIHFQCTNTSMETRFYEWLQDQFFRRLDHTESETPQGTAYTQ